MPALSVHFVRVGYRKTTLAPTCFNAGTFRFRRPEKTGFDRFHGVVQIMPKAMRIEGHPWEQVPSGSTTQPSVQHAGDVASHMALRAKTSKLSGVSENPSFSKASVALIR
jgi:hypothetical protein